MQTRQITETKLVRVTKTYWTCPVREHRHTTELAATNCCDRHSGVGRRSCDFWTDKERASVQAEKDAGATYKTLGIKYGVSAGRMRQVLIEWAEKKQRATERFERNEVRYAPQIIALLENIADRSCVW